MVLKKTKKTFQIDSADRDIRKYPTNGEYTIHLPRSYNQVTSLRLKSAEINNITRVDPMNPHSSPTVVKI
jgi:hypothetical protein